MAIDTDGIVGTAVGLAVVGVSLGVAKKAFDWSMTTTKKSKGKAKGWWV